MTDWAAWGTSVGTLVLAGATFAAVRSSNRSARIAERSLLAGLRPALTTPWRDDPRVQVQFADGRMFDTGWGDALVRRENGVIYVAFQLMYPMRPSQSSSIFNSSSPSDCQINP